ncbi:MAG TPA: ribbon-helix-helix protein, CopG family [Microbacterium sp.]|nr:ribbon-helix-helix protein, CopG family [Microbacterium sp.]
MRTTVILPDELYRQVKERARAEDRTVTSFLEDALRNELARRHISLQEEDVEAYIAEPFHGTGVRPGVDLTSNAALLELMDEGIPIEKLR